MSDPKDVTDAARQVAEADGPPLHVNQDNVPNAGGGFGGLLLSGAVPLKPGAQQGLLSWIRGRGPDGKPRRRKA